MIPKDLEDLDVGETQIIYYQGQTPSETYQSRTRDLILKVVRIRNVNKQYSIDRQRSSLNSRLWLKTATLHENSRLGTLEECDRDAPRRIEKIDTWWKKWGQSILNPYSKIIPWGIAPRTAMWRLSVVPYWSPIAISLNASMFHNCLWEGLPFRCRTVVILFSIPL